MSAIMDECKLSFYQEITPLNEKRQFWLVRHKQTGKYFVKKNLPLGHRDVYEALRGITTRNLPRIYECISLENGFVVIEEFINGDTLEELVQQQKMTPGQAVGILVDVCNVLFILHSMMPPIIHRDIKPENIMLSNDGVVKLMDFDIARTYDRDKNRDTEYMGTVGYAAPEHFGFGQTDARSDIYSCGVVLNYLLTGHMPDEKLAEEPLGTVVKKCVQINPIHRYQNVFELRQALGGVMGNVSGKQEDSSYVRGWQKFLPPGFRTLKPWKMLVAVVSYAAILDIAATSNFVVKSATELVLNRIFAGLGMIGSVLVLFNYLGVADRLPGAGRDHGKAFWVLRCIYAFAVFLLMIFILVILVDILR